MHILRRRYVRIAVVLLALALSGAPTIASHTAHASGPSVLEMRVEVSYKGFNGEPDFTIEAEQGQVVDLTFVWVDTAVPDNSHRIEIKDFGVKSSIINADNREATVSFIADKAGTFAMQCTWRCEGHKEALQNGHLKVKSGGGASGGGGTTLTGTSIAVEPSAWDVSGPITLTSTLVDDSGQPIVDAPVSFFVDAEFAGTKGPMEIGVSRTDEDGVAALDYTPTTRGDQLVKARFDGAGLYAESEETLELNVLKATPAYIEAPKGLESLRHWAPAGVGVVVLGIWSVFGYVAYQVVRIRGGGA